MTATLQVGEASRYAKVKVDSFHWDTNPGAKESYENSFHVFRMGWWWELEWLGDLGRDLQVLITPNNPICKW